jgi:hypothetical protein
MGWSPRLRERPRARLAVASLAHALWFASLTASAQDPSEPSTPAALVAPSAAAADPAPVVTPPQAPPINPDQRLRRGKSQFDYGDCTQTIDLLAPLAVPGSLADPKDQVSVHWMLGVCYALVQKPTEAAREFSSLLVLDPDYAIDAMLTPPAAVEVFERQRAQMNAQLEEIRSAREQAKRTRRDAERGVLVERELVVREVPLAAVFLPFGLAQVANGETGWAILFGATQGAFLATNVSAYWVNFGYKAGGIPTAEERTAHTIAYFTHIAALGAFGLAYGGGVAQAWWSREDHVVVDRKQTKRALTPEEVKRLKDVPPPPRTP